MERFTGLIGIALIFGIAYLASNNRKAINYRLVLSGVGLQLLIAILVLKIPPVTAFFQKFSKTVADTQVNDPGISFTNRCLFQKLCI